VIPDHLGRPAGGTLPYRSVQAVEVSDYDPIEVEAYAARVRMLRDILGHEDPKRPIPADRWCDLTGTRFHHSMRRSILMIDFEPPGHRRLEMAEVLPVEAFHPSDGEPRTDVVADLVAHVDRWISYLSAIMMSSGFEPFGCSPEWTSIEEAALRRELLDTLAGVQRKSPVMVMPPSPWKEGLVSGGRKDDVAMRTAMAEGMPCIVGLSKGRLDVPHFTHGDVLHPLTGDEKPLNPIETLRHIEWMQARGVPIPD
jgi:hypothetical protein